VGGILQQIEKLFKHKELEQQLSDAKLAQANLQFAEEKERNLTEKQKVAACFLRTVNIYLLRYCMRVM
jgi:hypothetical protein